MKQKNIYAIALCVLFFALTGCKKKDKSQDPETFLSNIAQPTWTVPANYDYSSSLTAIIKVDIASQYPDRAAGWRIMPEDQLAAFVGEQCVGVAELHEDLFYLYITPPNSENNDGDEITLRYYSAYCKNIFEAWSAFNFVNDDMLGTIIEPLKPVFTVAK